MKIKIFCEREKGEFLREREVLERETNKKTAKILLLSPKFA